jgi:hypothetical protein
MNLIKRPAKNLIMNWNPAIAQTAAWIFLFFGVTLGSLLLVA